MKINRIHFIEKFILITFPIALAVGCAAVSEQQSNVVLADENTRTQAKNDNTVPENIVSGNNESSVIVASLKDIPDQGDFMDNKNSALNNIDQPASSAGEQPTRTMYNDDIVEVNLRASNETPESTVPEKEIFYFGVNKYDVVESDYEVLQQHATYLKQHPDKILFVDGFADSRGSARNNYRLSNKRAQTIASLLVSYGAPENQIKINGYGESFPMSNDNNWDENRRVELEYADIDNKDKTIARFN